VIGLGNPGRRYAGTRHNAGFAFIHRLARHWESRLGKSKFSARIAEVKTNEGSLILAQPQTYMNLSGLAVKQIMDGYRMGPENIVVVYDDLDIPLGQIRVRKAGSAGTHKGLRSVIGAAGTTSFLRLRIGIGPLPEGEEATGYVLAPFTARERPLLEEGLARAEEALDFVLDGRVDEAMNTFNKKSMM
jgi:PTH1 family peptidyl-tRNA hydrolase